MSFWKQRGSVKEFRPGREELREFLCARGWKINACCRELGVSRETFSKRLRSLGLRAELIERRERGLCGKTRGVRNSEDEKGIPTEFALIPLRRGPLVLYPFLQKGWLPDADSEGIPERANEDCGVLAETG